MDKIIIIMDKEELISTLKEIISEKELTASRPEFEKERINRTDASKLANVSPPTFAKMINAGVFREHGFGRKKFFLKSEIISALTKEKNL